MAAVVDPRDIDSDQLDRFDPAWLTADYDEHEPLVLERVYLTAGDSTALGSVPISADSCVFTGCDLSLVNFQGVKHSRFTGAKLLGTRFDRHVLNVVFESCQLTECLFRMMGLKQAVFDSCRLARCDFYGSELTDVSFPGSEFAGVGFDACAIDRVDLSEANDLMIGDPRTLRGATLSEMQLPSIAHRLAELSGIEISE